MPFYSYKKDSNGVITLDLRGTALSVLNTLRQLQARKLKYDINQDEITFSSGRRERSCVVVVYPN